MSCYCVQSGVVGRSVMLCLARPAVPCRVLSRTGYDSNFQGSKLEMPFAHFQGSKLEMPVAHTHLFIHKSAQVGSFHSQKKRYT